MYFFCKQKTAYEMRISDWSSDGCSSDLATPHPGMKTTDDSGQTVQRVKVAMTGLALVLLLIGVASVIFSSASSDTPADLAGTVQSDLVAHLSLTTDVQDRQSVVWGKGVSVRLEIGGRRLSKKKNINQ